MADHTAKSGLRWAAGFALAAVGAAAIYNRVKAKSPGHPSLAQVSELSVGRGTSKGPIDLASRKAGYEVQDTNVRALVAVMVVSILIMIGGVTGVFFMFRGFDRHFIAQSVGETSEQRAEIVPPLPHLQAEPYHEIEATLMEQSQRLTTYGWNDAAHQSAHLPIQRAMDQVIGKPLDTPATADASGPAGTDDLVKPGPQGSGAEQSQAKPANHVPGEGRPGAVAPGYDPNAATAK